MPTAPFLSALIVNYNSAALTRDCVSSLRTQRLFRPDGTPGEVEILVVDNASQPGDRALLDDIEATVLYHDDNRGYGAALNTAFSHARGEFILFSNPDTWYFPGAVPTLIDAYGRLPHCGAVGPRLWWDRNQNFLLPPGDPVTLLTYLQETAAHLWPRWRRHWERRWLDWALAYWQVQQPSLQAMLSGACILTRREVLTACGGFDEQFHLYYEDTDWCRRVRQHGYRLYYVPMADVAHLYNQSARHDPVAAERAFTASAERYFHKYYGAWRWKLASSIAAALHSRFRAPAGTKDYEALGPFSEPPRFSLPLDRQAHFLFLLSPLPSCTPAIARFASAPELSLPPNVWRQLGEGTFYTRCFSQPRLQLLGQWCWEKRSGRGENNKDEKTQPVLDDLTCSR